VDQPSGQLADAVTVEGVRDQHLGPRWEFAKVTMRVEPAEQFEARFAVGEKQAELEERGFLNAAVYGFLDVSLVSASMPLRNVRLVIVNAEAHEVDSSQRAFRMAGRDAARRLLQQMDGL
jgi:translation elongation factor EF-G